MKAVDRALDLYCALAKALAVACMVTMVGLVFGNVVLRYAFNSGIAASEELSRWLLVWLTFFGAIVALREHRHLGVDVFVRKLPPAGRMICFVLSHLLMIYASWLLASGSWTQTLITATDTAPASGLSVGLFYVSGVYFGVSALIILVLDLVRVLTSRVQADDLVMVRDSEEV